MGAFSSILRRHGIKSVIHTAHGMQEVASFLEPIISRAENAEWFDVTRLGERNVSRWYWFGPPECEIFPEEETYITVSGTDYDVLKAEPYTVNGRISHWEAVLSLREEIYDG